MRENFTVKAFFLAVILFLLLIPLGLIEGVVKERATGRALAKMDIQASWSTEQRVTGPILLASHLATSTIQTRDANGQPTPGTISSDWTTQKILPKTMRVRADLQSERRYRGIYSLPIYTADMEIDTDFEIPAGFQSEIGDESLNKTSLDLVIGLNDTLAIQGTPSCSWQGKDYDFQAGVENVFPSGMTAALGKIAPETPQLISLKCRLQLRGSSSFQISPIGKNSEIAIKSNWEHPKFLGAFLPTTREISNEGFNAVWKTSHFSSNWEELMTQCDPKKNVRCMAFTSGGIGAELFQPVDIYMATLRAVKYGLLIVGLTFISFLLFEILTGLRIHTIQYSFVGLSMAVFYLLLVSLSEHLSFGVSYLVAALACISTLTFYSSAVLGGIGRSVRFCAALSALYGALYVVLLSEDFALLLGSSLTFAVLTIAMISTRSVDWYRLTAREKSGTTSPILENQG